MILIGYLDLGHLIDTLNYLATPTPKNCRFFAIHLVNHLVWMGKGDHSKNSLPLAL